METASSGVIPAARWQAYPLLTPLVVGALVVLELSAGLALSRYGVRFDGFMDIHRTALGGPVSVSLTLADQVASILVPLAVMQTLVRGWRSEATSTAGAAIALVARLPIILVGMVILWMPLSPALLRGRVDTIGALQPLIVVPALITLGCAVIGCTLMVVGIRRSTGARGPSLALRSVGAFLLAELAGTFVYFLVR